jgi:hypothetical protein
VGETELEWVMKNLKFLKYQVEVELNEKPDEIPGIVIRGRQVKPGKFQTRWRNCGISGIA